MNGYGLCNSIWYLVILFYPSIGICKPLSTRIRIPAWNVYGSKERYGLMEVFIDLLNSITSDGSVTDIVSKIY